jgi:septal ring factor EnvC (AmiA/AmiB activator)
MTDDELNRIEKQFDSLEETLRDGFTRMRSKLDQFGEVLTLFAQVTARLDALEAHLDTLERKGDERHAELLAILRGLQR